MLQRSRDSAPGASQHAESAGYEARLSDLVLSLKGILRRRWLTLAIVTATVMAIFLTLIMLMPASYQAVSRVQIDPMRDPTLPVATNVQADLGSEAIETEVTILNSGELARKVVHKLNLQRDPEFNPALKGGKAAELSPEEQFAATALAVQKKIAVGRDRMTYIINIAFTSDDAQKSATIANTFAETYISEKVGSRVGTAAQQTEFYRKRLTQLANEVRAADSAVAAYRARAGIVEGMGNSTVVDQQIAPLSSQLATAESEAAEARANLQAARSQIARGGLDAVSAVRGSPVVSDLRRQRAEVLRNMGEVRARYGERHPESIKVNDQLAALDQQIKDEAQRAIGSLEAEARAADARVASLRATMRRVQGEQSSNTRAAATANTLEREAESKRAAYDRLAESAQRSEQNVSNTIARATIVDKAVAPSSPTSPNRPLLAALALIVSLATGAATIIVQELLVAGIRSVADFQSQIGLPIIASLPAVKKGAPSDLVVDRPGSMYAESVRIARTGLARLQPPAKTIAITSALPQEGKSTTSASLARVFAAGGERVLLVDCDVRRAGLNHSIPTSSSASAPGLLDVLSGNAKFDDALIPDRVEGLDVIYVPEPRPTADDLFEQQMEPFLAQAREKYDRIILDLPPLGGLADGRIIAPLADATLLVVRWGSTPASALESAAHWLEADGANVAGAVFSIVDPNSEAMGGLYYSSKYGNYYQAD